MWPFKGEGALPPGSEAQLARLLHAARAAGTGAATGFCFVEGGEGHAAGRGAGAGALLLTGCACDCSDPALLAGGAISPVQARPPAA